MKDFILGLLTPLALWALSYSISLGWHQGKRNGSTIKKGKEI